MESADWRGAWLSWALLGLEVLPAVVTNSPGSLRTVLVLVLSPGKLGQLVTLFPDKCQAQNFHLWETNKLDNWKVEIMTLGQSG